jgi:glycosyltransferase involved in cell wall biosynthesis
MSLGLGKGMVVGFSGELRFKKGMHHLIETAKNVSQTVSDVKFLLVGGVRSDDREEFDSLLEEDPALKQIIVETPYVKDAQKLAEYYNLMDVMFLPSLWEGTPNAALEAMACGIPIVASDAGGLKDLIERPKNGFTYPAGDLEAAVETLTHVLTTPGDARRAMAARAREKITTEFTPYKEIGRILEIFNRIIPPK